MITFDTNNQYHLGEDTVAICHQAAFHLASILKPYIFLIVYVMLYLFKLGKQISSPKLFNLDMISFIVYYANLQQ